MLRLYTRQADQLVPLENLPTDMHAVSCLWLDLITPTPEEDRWVETYLGVSIPTRDEMEEIELSSRLYRFCQISGQLAR
jgi:magnesium transporter